MGSLTTSRNDLDLSPLHFCDQPQTQRDQNLFGRKQSTWKEEKKKATFYSLFWRLPSRVLLHSVSTTQVPFTMLKAAFILQGLA